MIQTTGRSYVEGKGGDASEAESYDSEIERQMKKRAVNIFD